MYTQLFLIGVIILAIGYLTFLGSSSKGFREGAQTQNIYGRSTSPCSGTSSSKATDCMGVVTCAMAGYAGCSAGVCTCPCAPMGSGILPRFNKGCPSTCDYTTYCGDKYTACPACPPSTPASCSSLAGVCGDNWTASTSPKNCASKSCTKTDCQTCGQCNPGYTWDTKTTKCVATVAPCTELTTKKICGENWNMGAAGGNCSTNTCVVADCKTCGTCTTGYYSTS